MDKYDEQAEVLLDCFCYRHIEPFREHHGTCPAYYRPAVAAALRELEERHDKLWDMDRRIIAELKDKLAAKDAELAECVQSGLAVARDFTQRMEARLDDSPRVQHWKRKAEHFLERAQAAERERDEARDEIAKMSAVLQEYQLAELAELERK